MNFPRLNIRAHDVTACDDGAEMRCGIRKVEIETVAPAQKDERVMPRT